LPHKAKDSNDRKEKPTRKANKVREKDKAYNSNTLFAETITGSDDFFSVKCKKNILEDTLKQNSETLH
jgi:hypothetical protein